MSDLTINSHFVADVAIAAAYATIPVTAIYHLSRFAREARPLVALAAAFLLSCGLGHLFDGLGWTRLVDYWRWVMAGISWASAIAFAVVLPRALRRTALLSTIVENLPIGLGLLREEIDGVSGKRQLRWKLVSNRAIVDLGLDPHDCTLDDTSLGQEPLSTETFFEVLDTNIPILRREVALCHPLSGKVETYLISCVSLPERYLWVVWQDITARQQAYASLQAATEKLEWQATHDYLTQASNLVLFDRLQLQEPNRFGALLSIDIDRFKSVNETLGHNVGDFILKQIVQRFCELLTERDAIVRAGADGFMILLEAPEARDATLAEVAQQFYTALRCPFTYLDRDLKIDARIGYVDRQAGDLAAMRIAADIAMNAAKCNPIGERIVPWTSALMDRVCTRQEIALDLERALQCLDDEFELHYQPIVRLNDPKRCYEVEALLRWNSPTLGRVSPTIFVPLAEETGAIAELTDWVVERSIVQARHWNNGICIALNVSPWDLERDGFADRVLRLCEEYGVQPSRIALEITERAVTDKLERFTDVLQQLGDAGIRLKIDDFGTGDSGLVRILAAQWHEVKIDRSLLPESSDDLGRLAICRAIATLCHDLRIGSLAEGIETEEQRLLLSELGIEDAQGYLFARPMPEDELAKAGWVRGCES
ncbi:MAG: putative bifunctional diguanylate cyclase/phosphodiesterase [Geitlerinemataceae cyanobacterium]